ENVFENRFALAGDLNRMGANIRVAGRAALIQGVEGLTGVHAAARDLRSGAALVVAALAARGETLISGVELIDRGYAGMEEALSGLGAVIRRVPAAE
ncbi:MAG: UDP-N-acetylglucosamine 1-carboxyvinyltransferase, partial [Clostridia bacterium]|nr:UDP-N-acetylglucosamine 1-carboxyvinyltransferase [Clostridia bacterium]